MVEEEPLTVSVKKLVCILEDLNRSLVELKVEVEDFKQLFKKEIDKLVKATLGWVPGEEE